MAYLDLIYQNEDFVALENKKFDPILWFDDRFGVDLSGVNYRRVYRNNGAESIMYSDEYEDMYYDVEAGIVLLVDYDSCGFIMWRKNGFTDSRGIYTDMVFFDGFTSGCERWKCVHYIELYVLYLYGLDISDMFKNCNLDCKVYPFLRLQSIDSLRSEHGLSVFGEDMYPIVYVVGTEGYEKYFDKTLDAEPCLDTDFMGGECEILEVDDDLNAFSVTPGEPVIGAECEIMDADADLSSLCEHTSGEYEVTDVIGYMSRLGDTAEDCSVGDEVEIMDADADLSSVVGDEAEFGAESISQEHVEDLVSPDAEVEFGAESSSPEHTEDLISDGAESVFPVPEEEYEENEKSVVFEVEKESE